MVKLSEDVLLSETEIAERVRELAKDISRDYEDRPLVVIGILKGSFIFLADLVRQLSCTVTCEFVRVVMTEEDSLLPREIRYTTPFTVENTHVLIVEDILDTGITLKYLIDHFTDQNPSSLSICVLLDKVEARKTEVNVAYTGFEIPNKYVVGYGLDYEERHRELPYITWMDGAHWPL